MTAPALKVTRLYEDDELIVRGTDDVDAARAAAREFLRAELEADGWDGEDLAEQLARVDRLRPRVGWYRWNPCNENSCFDGGGHSGHLGYVDGPGRGSWRGVYFR